MRWNCYKKSISRLLLYMYSLLVLFRWLSCLNEFAWRMFTAHLGSSNRILSYIKWIQMLLDCYIYGMLCHCAVEIICKRRFFNYKSILYYGIIFLLEDWCHGDHLKTLNQCIRRRFSWSILKSGKIATTKWSPICLYRFTENYQIFLISPFGEMLDFRFRLFSFYGLINNFNCC